jgi:hypothetical protein
MVYLFEIDSTFFRYSDYILRAKEGIIKPGTPPGEEILKEASNNPFFQKYNRLLTIFGSLIALLEYEEILGSRPFEIKDNQRIILRSLGMIAEEEIKRPYSKDKLAAYSDYKTFLENFLRRLRSLDKQIESGRFNSDFLSALIVAFSGEVRKSFGELEVSYIDSLRIKDEINKWLYNSMVKGIADYKKVVEALKEKAGGFLFFY